MKLKRVWLPDLKEIRFDDIEYADFPSSLRQLSDDSRIDILHSVIMIDKLMLENLLETTCKSCGQKITDRMQQVLPEMLYNLLKGFETRKLTSDIHIFKRNYIDRTDAYRWELGIELCAWAMALKQSDVKRQRENDYKDDDSTRINLEGALF